MYVNLNQLKRLSAIKTGIQEDSRNRKLQTQDIHLGIERLYKPVFDSLKQTEKDNTTAKQESAVESQLAIDHPPKITAIEVPPTKEQPRCTTLRLWKLADRYRKIPSISYDHAYGIKPVEGTTYFGLGRMDVKIDGDDFFIDEEKYDGTVGQSKLLTLKNPGEASPEDL